MRELQPSKPKAGQPHIWDILDQVDAEDREAMQNAYNLIQTLRKELWKLGKIELLHHAKPVTVNGPKLYEMACKLNHIISHWWELYIEKQMKAEGAGSG